MTTLEAIVFILNTKKSVKLLSINAELKYSTITNDVTLLINDKHSLSINKCVEIDTIAMVVEQDLEYYTNSFNWLKPIDGANTGTTITYERAWKKANKVIFNGLQHEELRTAQTLKYIINLTSNYLCCLL